MRVTLSTLKRSTWKGPHIVPLKLYRPDPAVPHPPIKTMARSCTILPNFVGLKFAVHNGKVYHTIEIKDNMVGYKLGDFSPTRKRAIQDGSGGKR